jgi:hypothetical protein
MPSALRAIVVLTAASLLGCSAIRVSADEMRPTDLRQADHHKELGENVVDGVGVKIDFAKVLAFAEPARTIIIGNPAIVDGILSDDHTIVLTGRAVGVTNLIVLGEGGREVLNTIVNVTPSRYRMTTVYSGTTLNTFSCTGSCKPTLSVGDEGSYFARTRDQTKERQDLQGAGGAPR